MAANESIRSLKLDAINTSAGTQIRATIDQLVVDDYAAAMLDVANKFPPVVVFKAGDEMILADGFHRVMAARQNEFKDILADVRPGGRADALRHALSANAAHGLRRTNQDKRHSVQLALQEWLELSDRELAKICAVSDHFVGDIRKESTANESQLPQARIGADGKKRKLPAKKKANSVHPTPPLPEPEEPARVQSYTPEPNFKRIFQSGTRSEKCANRWWYHSAKPEKRGQFVRFLLNSGKPVQVENKELFTEFVMRWLAGQVSETGRPTP